MPRRSSRSRPASRTSLSDPTGSASLAIAITGNLTAGVGGPVERVADRLQTGPRFLAAEGSDHAGLVKGARIEAERGRRLVVAGQVGVEHRGVVGRDAAADAGGDKAGQRGVRERGDGPGAGVRERADVEDGGAAGELPDEARGLLGADSVAGP